MQDDYRFKNNKILVMIIVSGMIGLITFSFLPLISETISSDNKEDFYEIVSPTIVAYYDQHPNETVTTNIYYTSGSLKHRENDDINKIYFKTVMIQICYWALVVFGILGFIGLLLNIAKQYFKISNIILLLGCITLIASILILYLYFDIIYFTTHFDNISLASAFTKNNPFKYIFIPIVIGFFSLIGSSAYTTRVLKYTFKQKRKDKKIQMVERDIQQETIREKELARKTINIKEETPLYEKELLSELEENQEIDDEIPKQGLQQNIENQEKLERIREEFKVSLQETKQKTYSEQTSEKETQDKTVQTDEIKSFEKEASDHFKSKKEKTQNITSDQVSDDSKHDEIMKSFDKVLSSAIEKKKKEREKKNKK